MPKSKQLGFRIYYKDNYSNQLSQFVSSEGIVETRLKFRDTDYVVSEGQRSPEYFKQQNKAVLDSLLK